MFGALLRATYIIGLTLLFPLIILRLLWRSRHHVAYRHRIAERFGCFPQNSFSGIWIHAVSVGESRAAFPLVRSLKETFPQKDILFTTMTPTASAQVQNTLANQVLHTYLPYDHPWIWWMWFRKVRPELLVLIETELWPNLLYFCKKHQIPVMIANARLSERSTKRYAKASSLLPGWLDAVTSVATQSQEDTRRFIEAGFPASILHCAGNLKFELNIPGTAQNVGEELRRQWGAERPIWVMASSHEGEEEIAIRTHQALLEHYPSALMVLVPRHPERFMRVATLLQKSKLQFVRRSEKTACDSQKQVVLMDSMGELLAVYAAVDIAVIGGSFVPVGGHNPLEAAALGRPMIIGPYSFNCEESVRCLAAASAGAQVADEDALLSQLKIWFQDDALRHQAGEQAQQVIESNKGTLDRLISQIQLLLLEP